MNWTKPRQVFEAPTDPQGQPAPAAPAATDAPDLSFVPADFVADGKPDLVKFSQHYQALEAKAAQRAEAEALIPQDGTYALELPADFKVDGLPEGTSIKLDLSNEAYQPLVADAQAFLKEIGAPANAGPKLATMIARLDATRIGMADKARQAELTKLGNPSQVTARLTTLERALQAKLPAEVATAVMSMTTNAAVVRGLEALLAPKDLANPPASPQKPQTREQMLRDYYATPSK